MQPITPWQRWRRPKWWIAATLALMAADIVAPAWMSLCIAHLVMLPVMWQVLHRRFITVVTSVQAFAIAAAGLAIAIERIATGAESVWIDSFPPARWWALAAVLATGSFHLALQGRLRRRLSRQRFLQSSARQRSVQIERVNRALRDEVARRQATQHQLDRNESQFLTLIGRMDAQLLRKDADGVFTYANEPFCRARGMDVREIVGSNDIEMFGPTLGAHYRQDDLKVMATGRQIEQVEEHPRPDGRRGFVQVFKVPDLDAAGNSIGVQVIFWDVTEKHRHAVELRESEFRKRALFEAAGDAVLLIDATGVVVEANPSAVGLLAGKQEFSPPEKDKQIAGFEVGPLVGEKADALLRLQPQATVQFRIDDGQSSGKPNGPTESDSDAGGVKTPKSWRELPLSRRLLLRIVRRDGVEFDAEISIHPIPIASKSGRAVILRDITPQQHAMRTLREAKATAEEANRSKTRILATISHELRTPLGGIRGLTEMLLPMRLPSTARRYVRLIESNTALLCEGIEDLLDFAAIELGRLTIDPQPIDLHQTIADAASTLSVRVSDKPVHLAMSIHPATPRHVIADPKRLRQIVVNLMGNAIKFTPRGEVAVRLQPSCEVELGETEAAQANHLGMVDLCLSVRDTGIGISEAHLRRIFEAFEQAEVGTNKRFGGTGLGLSIVRGLTEQMGGRIDVQSGPGGSVFHCHLRLRLAGERTVGAIGNPAPIPPLPPELRRRPVIVAIANATVAGAIEETVRGRGRRCHTRLPVAYQAGRGRWDNDEGADWTETLRHSGPLDWIVTAESAASIWEGRGRQSDDRVLWVQRAGADSPPEAESRDVVAIEPVPPDLIGRWLAGNDREGDDSTFTTAPKPKTVKTQKTAAGVPIDLTRFAPQLIRPDAPPADPSPPTAGRLMLVDDSSTNRLVIGAQLQRFGYEVVIAGGGGEAIELFANAPDGWACVLMDLQMPVLDGYQTTGRLRGIANQKRVAMPPVIALTAHVTEDHRRQCKRAGMAGFVSKPVDGNQLAREIRSVTQPSSAVQASPGVEVQPDGQTKSRPAGWQDEAIGRCRDQISQFAGQDPAMIRSLCQAFTNEAPLLMRKLRTAVQPTEAGELTDRAAARGAAHTLKSCLRYVAAGEDVAAAASLESRLADADDPPDPATLIAPVEALGDLVEQYLQIVGAVAAAPRQPTAGVS